MKKTRYFVFAHEQAFAACRVTGLEWRGGVLRTTSGTARAVLETPVLDSGENANAWQRVLADFTLDTGGHIIWRVIASDNSAETDGMSGAFVTENASDFLTVGVRGRYLRLAAEITGGAVLRSLLVFQERESFLDYLPEIYRDYNSFADRFLSIFTTQYLELEKKIDELPGTLDPRSAPDTVLRYLAKIAGVRNINLWDTEGLRQLLTSGIYRRHGQFSVFADYVEFFTGYKTYVAENFRFMTGSPANDALYAGADITIFLPPEAAGIDAEALDAVIADFLPEDIVWRVIVLSTDPVVSGYAYLGVNTRVGRYGQVVVGASRIGVTVIGGDN